MKKNNVIKALMFTTALAVVGGIGTMQNVAKVSADDSTFAVVATSIRTEDHETNGNGLRFAMVMDNTTYQNVTANPNAEIGVLILPTDMVAKLDNGLTLAAVSETGAAQAITYGTTTGTDNSSIDVSGWTTSTIKTTTQDYTNGYMMSTVYIWGTPKNAYNRPMTAVAYYDTDTTNGTDDAVYSLSKSASLSEVALRDGVDTYLNDYEVKFFDENEEVIETQTVKYGSVYAEPDMEETLQGGGTVEEPDYLLEGWYAKQPDGNWGTELITELTPEMVTKSMHFKAKLGDATVARWIAKVEDNVVTDFTTGNYTRIQNANTGLTYFQRINGSGYPQANPAIVTEEIGGITGTYARVGVGAGQGSSYPTIPYYLPNTMSVEKLQEFANSGYTLELNLYVDAPNVNINATVYTVTTNDSVLVSDVANMRAKTIVTNAWQKVEIDIKDYIALVTANGEDYKEQLSGQRAEATLCINLGGGEYDVYFDSIKVALPVAENITVLSPEEPSGWYNDTTNGFAWVHASNQGLGKQVIKTETVGGVSGTYSYLTQNKGNWNMAFLAVPTLPVSALERYCEQGYTLKLKLYADKAVTVRTVNYNKDENGNLTTRESITTTTDGAYTGEEISVPKNTWVDIAIDLKSYIQDCAITPTQITSTTAGSMGTIAVKGSWTFHVYLGDMYLEAPNGEDVKKVNEGETVTVEEPAATEGEIYEYYQVVDGKYTKLADNTVVAGASNFEIAVVKVTENDNGKKVRTIYKAYKVNVTSTATTA